MSVTYIQYPAGYPQSVRRVVKVGRKFAIETDFWHTPTSHDGARIGTARFSTEAAAEAALKEDEDRFDR